MGCAYTGEVEHKIVNTSPKGQFNWIALLVWLGSLIVSLVPIYLSALKYLIENNVIDLKFWFKCFTADDILWVFSTVLLFSLVNYFAKLYPGTAKKHSKSNLSLGLFVFGWIIFVFAEATWLFFKYVLKSFSTWPIVLGVIWVIIIMLISTPLQIDFIRSEE